MNIPLGLGFVVAFIVVAEIGRALVGKLFGYQAERHAIPIMKLPGMRGTMGFRLTLILAGPVTVYLATAAVAFAFFRCHGTEAPQAATVVTSVLKDHDASGKLEVADVIVEVDGAPFPGGAATLGGLVNAKAGAPIDLVVERAGERKGVTLRPTKRDDKWLLGVVLAAEREYSTTGSIKQGFFYPMRQAAETGEQLIKIFTGDDAPDAGGPIRIAEEFRRAFDTTTTELVLTTGMIFGTWTLLLLALFDLVRALFLILFRS